MNPYKTFWKRVGASLIDGIVLMLLGSLTSRLFSPNGEFMTLASVVGNNVMYLLYSVFLHGRYGQTLGKMLFRVKVLTSKGLSISYFRAFMRDIVLVVVMVMSAVIFATNAEYFEQLDESFAFIESHTPTVENIGDEEFEKHLNFLGDMWKGPMMWITYVSMMYFFLEVITMLTNKKRRAIHDFIAGTEVRRLEAVQGAGQKPPASSESKPE